MISLSTEQKLVRALPDCPECFDTGFVKSTVYEWQISYEIKMPCPKCHEEEEE